MFFAFFGLAARTTPTCGKFPSRERSILGPTSIFGATRDAPLAANETAANPDPTNPTRNLGNIGPPGFARSRRELASLRRRSEHSDRFECETRSLVRIDHLEPQYDGIRLRSRLEGFRAGDRSPEFEDRSFLRLLVRGVHCGRSVRRVAFLVVFALVLGKPEADDLDPDRRIDRLIRDVLQANRD